MYTPVNPSFTIYQWGLRGSKLYRYVFVMTIEGQIADHLILVYTVCSGLSVRNLNINPVNAILSPLRKHAYSNILKNLPPKKWKFSDKNSDIFHISAQNIDCGYSLEPPCRGGSNEYPQSMFLSRYKKNNVYPCKPQFYYIKVGFKGVKII